jgi:hypothetical protein
MFDWASLVGLRDNPAELVGYGPIPAALARQLAGDDGTVWRRLVFDPETGVLVDRGHKSYDVDETLRALIGARDLTCRYPGCVRNAVYCDIEHNKAFPEGATSCANCGLMCRKHHNRKTHDGFRYRRPDPATGETEWLTPLGFRYRQRSATYSPRGPDTGETLRVLAETLGDRFPYLKAVPPRPDPDAVLPDDPPF